MGANLSGNNIDNGDFMIKTCAADPEAGYAKEKFHADPKNGIIISEVDGPKGKRLEFSADWSVVSLDTKLQEGDNIKISEDQQTGKVEISSPNVGKVLVDSNDTTLKYLDEAITSSDNSIQHESSGNLENLTVPNLGKVKTGSEDTFGYLKDKFIDGVGTEVEVENNKVSISIKPSDFVSHSGITVEEGTGDDLNKIVIEKWQDIAFSIHEGKIHDDPDDFTPSYLSPYAATYVKTLIPDSGSDSYIGVGFYSGFEGLDGTISLRIYYKNNGINTHTFDIKELNHSYSLAQIVFPVISGYIDVNIDAADVAHNELFLIPTVEATENEDITIYRIMFLKL